MFMFWEGQRNCKSIGLLWQIVKKILKTEFRIRKYPLEKDTPLTNISFLTNIISFKSTANTTLIKK